jgi:hypothetical protein
MSKLTTTYITDDGGEIVPGTIEAWEAATKAARNAEAALDELPLGLVPDELREKWQDAQRRIFALRGDLSHITAEIRRFERTGHETPLSAALDDARFQGRI